MRIFNKLPITCDENILLLIKEITDIEKASYFKIMINSFKSVIVKFLFIQDQYLQISYVIGNKSHK